MNVTAPTRRRAGAALLAALVAAPVVATLGSSPAAHAATSTTVASSRAATSAPPRPATTTTVPKGGVIDIEMTAIAYAPKLVKVRAGVPVRFRFHNGATVDHEAFIGDLKAQDAHEKMMKAMAASGHTDHMAEPGYVLVKAGATVTLDYSFARAGRSIIGCHQPGHWASGMRMDVVVDPRTAMG